MTRPRSLPPSTLLPPLSTLNREHLRLSCDLYMLEVLRLQIERVGVQPHTKASLGVELMKVHHRLMKLHGALAAIAQTLQDL